MDRVNITFRQKKIILMLIENVLTPIRISDISKELNVSSRTISRELIYIEEFLNSYKINFIRKGGVGVYIDGDLDDILKVKDIINGYYLVNKYSKDHRILYILEKLLLSETKSSYFQNKFNISYMTFIKDIKEIREFLKDYSLSVKSKKGIGFYIEGREDKLRGALSYIFYEKFSDKDLFKLFKEDFIYESEFIDKEVLKFINTFIFDVFEIFNVVVDDRLYVSIMVHLSLTVYRVRRGFYIDFIPDFKGVYNSFEFKVSKCILNKLKDKFNLNISEGDIIYIAIYIRVHGAFLGEDGYDRDFNFDKLDKIKISGDIIKSVERDLQVKLIDNSSLIRNLSAHLGPSINRLIMNLNIRNPFLSMIKRDYSDVFNSVKKASLILKDIIGEYPGDDEIGYITMHILSAYETKIKNEFKYRVILYTEGKTSISLLLHNKILKEFPCIIIVETISSYSDLKMIDSIDFIISLRDIDKSYDYIKISPSFNDEDIMTIRNKIKLVYKEKSNKINTHICENKFIDIGFINHFGDIINLIKNEFTIGMIDKKFNSPDEIISYVLHKINVNNKEKIYREILMKELLGSSYLKDLKIIILHTLSKYADKLYIGSYTLKYDAPLYNGDLKTIFYFILPQDFNEEIMRKTIGELTSNLVKDDSFIDVLNMCDIKKVKAYIGKILNDYYVIELKNIIKSYENGIVRRV